MAWTAPMTAVSGSIFTAAQFNTHVRDNLNETAPAKASAASRWFVSLGLNDLRERAIFGDTVVGAETTTSTTYVNLATWGGTVTATTGTIALVYISSHMQVSTAAQQVFTSYEVSGATTISASDVWAIRMQASASNDDQRAGIAHYNNALTAGSNSFRMQYKTNPGTGTFGSRHIMVMAM